MRTTPLRLLAAALLTSPAWLAAGIAPDEAARLDRDLTPIGAERAGNAAGTIPAWTGGITEAPAGYKPGMHHPDPFAADAALFTITPDNAAQYKDQLTAGALALLQAYPDYKLIVFPTRRSASLPQYIYDATRRTAVDAKLAPDANGVLDAVVGVPFPIPANAQEVMWNHLLRFRGVSATRTINQATPTRGGDYNLVRFEEEFLFPYVREDMTPAKLDNIVFYFKQAVVAPARLAGSILLVHETLDQIKEPRSAWTYNTGQRRVRRAPEVAYDTPGTASDNLRTNDQLDMFNGALDRYDWKLLGKRELIVPYNSYRLHSDQVKYKEILTPLHINQDLARYELHRVWVVEATLKPGGKSHIYPRRTIYVDEDSWQILAVDQYDTRGQLWRVSEAHCINYYDVRSFWSTLEVHIDLNSGRYLAYGLDNEDKMYEFNVPRTAQNFAPASLRAEGMR
ncbi:MAG TPA: DUF1329 domain-containing protein [Opitutaceae bacterium]|nr:DUF1329 domain-containing protein [Opitutaceae bacterium]